MRDGRSFSGHSLGAGFSLVYLFRVAGMCWFDIGMKRIRSRHLDYPHRVRTRSLFLQTTPNILISCARLSRRSTLSPLYWTSYMGRRGGNVEESAITFDYRAVHTCPCTKTHMSHTVRMHIHTHFLHVHASCESGCVYARERSIIQGNFDGASARASRQVVARCLSVKTSTLMSLPGCPYIYSRVYLSARVDIHARPHTFIRVRTYAGMYACMCACICMPVVRMLIYTYGSTFTPYSRTSRVRVSTGAQIHLGASIWPLRPPPSHDHSRIAASLKHVTCATSLDSSRDPQIVVSCLSRFSNRFWLGRESSVICSMKLFNMEYFCVKSAINSEIKRDVERVFI